MKDFNAYSVGPLSASVCSSLGPEETVKRMNEEHPTGIDSPWSISKETHFRTGQPNPCFCEESPTTHMHYLLITLPDLEDTLTQIAKTIEEKL
jgi:hypothetical protein